jgi:hypothetical protein
MFEWDFWTPVARGPDFQLFKLFEKIVLNAGPMYRVAGTFICIGKNEHPKVPAISCNGFKLIN